MPMNKTLEKIKYKLFKKKAGLGHTLSFSIITIILFMAGFHNVDWAQNMERLNIHMYYATGQENFFVDQALTGKMWTYSQAYCMGMGMMISGALLFGFSMYKIGKRVSNKISVVSQERVRG